ncbi:hypothetical protein ABFB50_01055 [Dehalococcoides sp. THU3]|uniref:hypothetical protein n=1 Tax=Dehalococcoides sp. THU3 TaxID=3151601 RepID=UPI0025CA5921|nr:hypothetical protein [Dehalococcoides mccartyi]MDN4186783.1 hypothetical protein [Dehalococcoides mccartyi]
MSIMRRNEGRSSVRPEKPASVKTSVTSQPFSAANLRHSSIWPLMGTSSSACPSVLTRA